ncbi:MULTISPECIES: hypothetical protein [unclassified Ruegeria]|uniref:hypothetical protein n=1 Tax=unclassified Ruegeria TaxID=2625375 RepID=UPI0014899F05|nr:MULTISPECIES: hypothetical protein [unclassified Ruegeria]
MKLLFLTLAAVFLIGSTGVVQARDTRWEGVWQEKACGAPSSTLISNGRSAIYFEYKFGAYSVTVGSAQFSKRLALVSSNGSNLAIQTSEFRKCNEADPELQMWFGEVITIFLAYTDVEDICADNGHSAKCLKAAFELFDVTGNGSLSRAEISRGVRVAGFFAAYMGARTFAEASSGQTTLSVNAAEVSGSSVIANIVSPVLAQNMLASYDFDDDGSLSLNELMTDRENVGPVELAKLIGDATIQEIFEFGANWILSMTGSLGTSFLR